MEIKDLIKKNVAFHCDTEEKANELLQKAHQLGYKWCDGHSYLDKNFWETHRTNTCYDIYNGLFGGYEFFRKEGYNIIEYILDKDLVEPIMLDCDVLGYYAKYGVLKIKDRYFEFNYVSKSSWCRLKLLSPQHLNDTLNNFHKPYPLENINESEINILEFLYNQLIQNDCSEILLESIPENKEDYCPIIYKLNLIYKEENDEK